MLLSKTLEEDLPILTVRDNIEKFSSKVASLTKQDALAVVIKRIKRERELEKRQQCSMLYGFSIKVTSAN